MIRAFAVLACLGTALGGTPCRAGDFAAATWDGSPVAVRLDRGPEPVPLVVPPRPLVSTRRGPALALAPVWIGDELSPPRGLIYNVPPPPPPLWSSRAVVRARF